MTKKPSSDPSPEKNVRKFRNQSFDKGISVRLATLWHTLYMQEKWDQKKKKPETFYDQHPYYHNTLKCWEKIVKQHKVWKTETKTGFTGQKWAYVNYRHKVEKIQQKKSWIYTNCDFFQKDILRINIILIVYCLSIFSDLKW